MLQRPVGLHSLLGPGDPPHMPCQWHREELPRAAGWCWAQRGSCPRGGGLRCPRCPVIRGRDRSASSLFWFCNEQWHQRRRGREDWHETPGPCKPQAMSSFSSPRGVLIKLVNPEPNQLSEPHQPVVSRAEPGKSCTCPQPITAKRRAVQTETTKETWRQ